MKNIRKRYSNQEVIYNSLDEDQFGALASKIAKEWHFQSKSNLVIGLEGALGSGKTTWVRGMLAGLGYEGRVPSPTYTIVEQYELEGLSVMHLDLYRLPESNRLQERQLSEFEALGVREWMSKDEVWLIGEWPSRSPQFIACVDIWINFEFQESSKRRVILSEATTIGQDFLKLLS